MKSLGIAFLLAFPAIILAQPNYHEGYVLKNNGDTLKGYINYREWAYSPLTVEFKGDKNAGQTQEFTPQTIKGFGIYNAETYASYVGLITMNKNVFPEIPNSLDTTRQQGSIFLKPLVMGNRVTLYLNNEVNKNRFFIAEKNEIPVELKYYEYYGASNSDEIYDNLFRGQLLLLIYKYKNGDAKLISKLKDVKFEQLDLENIVDEINDVHLAIQRDSTNHKQEKSNVRFYGGIGINSIGNTYNYSQLVTTTNSVSTVYGSHRSNSLAPKFDFGVDMFINPDIQQFVFRTELAYSPFGGHFGQPATANTAAIDLLYTGYYLTLTPQFLFSVYNKENLKIYIDAGFGLHVASYSNNENGNDQSYIIGPASGFYLPIQAGIIFNKKFELSFTYNSFTTRASYPSVYVSNKLSTSVGLKIFFN